MSLSRYALIVLAIVAGSLGLVWPVLADPAAQQAALLGGALAAVNTLIAYSLVVYAQGRSTNVFLRAVLGGMVGRMGLLLAAVVVAILRLGLPKVTLVVSLLSYFVFFLVLELTILHRHTTPRAVTE